MFIKCIINKFFKLESKFNIDDLKIFANKYINNKELIDEISLKNKFKKQWRKSINSNIYNENYQIIDIRIDKDESYAKCYIKINHSFHIANISDINSSKEICLYIILMIKVNNKWKIEDIINKEYFPSMYRNVSQNNLSTYNNNSKFRRKYYESKLIKLEDIKNEFKKCCKSYKSNYLERTYPKKYDYISAIEYARKYALESNPAFVNFDNMGGDCTNFISQCLHAGNLPYNSSWKPYTNAWIRVNELYYYLIRRNLGIDDTKSNTFDIGSVIQFYSNTKKYFSHSGILTFSLSNGDYLYCCHTYNKKDFPLSEIFPIFYDKIRIIKIQF